MLGVNIIWPRAGWSPAINLHSRFPYRLVLKLMPQDDIYRIIDQVSQQLSSHAEHYREILMGVGDTVASVIMLTQFECARPPC